MAGPHDQLFRATFSQPEQARAFLREVLPKAVAKALDWEALASQPERFVDEALKERQADLVFSVPWKQDACETPPALVTILFEHQSSPEPLMAFRMAAYTLRIWERHVLAEGAPTLPFVFPLVLYHGKRSWRAGLDLAELIDVPPMLAGPLRAFVPS